jgi:hypothetical protein
MPNDGSLANPSLSLMLRPTVRRPVYLGIKNPSGIYDQIFISVRQLRVCWYGVLICNCCWSSPAQLFSGPSPAGLVNTFYCLRFETSLFVASYDSQGYGTGIRHRLHTEFTGEWTELSLLELRGEPNISHHVLHFLCYSVFFCVYPLQVESAYRTVAQQWIIPRLFFATRTCLPNRCLAMLVFVTIRNKGLWEYIQCWYCKQFNKTSSTMWMKWWAQYAGRMG